MRILVDINHPAHVHFFRHFIREMEGRGHTLAVTARRKEVAFQLLDHYGIDYVDRGTSGGGLVGKLVGMPRIDYRLYKIAKEFKPDVITSIGSIYASHASSLMRRPHITFDDTDHSWDQRMLYKPFTDIICTPSCFMYDLGKKQIRYEGYHELAYLHPNRFTPDIKIIDEIGSGKNERYFILRFVSWSASHDIGHRGFSVREMKKLIDDLSVHGRVYITSEKQLKKEFEKYRISVHPSRIHDILAFADLYIGEGGTMASEAACLGIPSIFLNTIRLGYLNEQEKRYGLTLNFSDARQASEKAIELVEQRDLKEKWQKKKDNMLKDKIDVTDWMIKLFEGYE